MMKTAPEVALTTAGALNRPTEAEQPSTLIMASGRASHLPHRLQGEPWQAQGGKASYPLMPLMPHYPGRAHIAALS
jgi:hypothetical protein